MNLYFLDAEVKLLVAEKQQWLLHQRMSRAKDMQISKLQYAVDQMQGKCSHVKILTIQSFSLFVPTAVRPWPMAIPLILVFKQTISL